jgi:hypothetical protein
MLPVYFVTYLIGVGVAGVMISVLFLGDEDRVFRVAQMAGAGLVVAGYSLWQAARPTPKPDHPDDSDS